MNFNIFAFWQNLVKIKFSMKINLIWLVLKVRNATKETQRNQFSLWRIELVLIVTRGSILQIIEMHNNRNLTLDWIKNDWTYALNNAFMLKTRFRIQLTKKTLFEIMYIGRLFYFLSNFLLLWHLEKPFCKRLEQTTKKRIFLGKSDNGKCYLIALENKYESSNFEIRET